MTTREDTLRQWLAEHRGILVRISRAYADRPGDDEDLLQDILLALWRDLPRFRGESKVSTLIYQVALNAALSRHRARQRRPEPASLDEAGERANDGARAAEQRLRWSAVLAALRRVPPVDRAVLLMASKGPRSRRLPTCSADADHRGLGEVSEGPRRYEGYEGYDRYGDR